MKKRLLINPTALAVALTAFAVYTPPRISFTDYAAPLLVIFALAAKAMMERTEKYFILVGYLFWTMAYAVMIYYGITKQMSTWPMFCGTYWVLNEFFVSFTSLFEPKEHANTKYVTPLYVRIGYGIFLSFDVVLNAMTIYYGTGDKYDELGLLPMETLSDRISTFCLWMGFWSAALVAFPRVFNPRQVKYFMYAFIYISHVSELRLPIFASYPNDAGLSAILKLQTFGSAIYVARFSSPTLPSPTAWFRTLMIGMPLFCAWTTTSMFETTITMPVQTFALYLTSWLVFFWVVIVAVQAVQGKEEAQKVFPVGASAPKAPAAEVH